MVANERIIILGASGFIGSHLAEVLEDEGLRRVERHSSSTCNLLCPAAVAQLLGCDTRRTTIVYASGINRASGDTFEELEKNLRMVHTVAQSVRGSSHVRNFVFLSSVDVYGFPTPGTVIDEITPLAPTTFYGLGKLAAERILEWELPSELPLACLRLPGLFGAYDCGISLLGRFAAQIKAGKSITLMGNGEVKRDLLPVGVLARVVCAVVAKPRRLRINIVTGQSLALRTWAELLAAQLGKPVALELHRDRGPRDVDLEFSPAAFHEAFPELATFSIAEHLQLYAAAKVEQGTR